MILYLSNDSFTTSYLPKVLLIPTRLIIDRHIDTLSSQRMYIGQEYKLFSEKLSISTNKSVGTQALSSPPSLKPLSSNNAWMFHVFIVSFDDLTRKKYVASLFGEAAISWQLTYE